jgi:MFS family permease
VVGAAGGMFLYAALLSLGAVLALPLSIRPGPSRDPGYRDSFRSGWRYLTSKEGRPLLHLAFVDAVRAFFTAGVALLITLVSVRSFANAGAAYSVLFATYVVGGVVAGLALGWLNPRGRAGLVIVGSLVACGLGFVAAGLVPPVLALAVLTWLLVGLGLTGFFTAKEAFVAGSVDPGKLARVSANMYLFPGITSAIGALVLGALADSATPLSFGLILGAGLLAAGLFALRWPGARALRY